MAGFPQLGATIDFGNGAAFVSTALTLDSATLGLLDTAQLADGVDLVDISPIILQASIRRGRNRYLDKFEAGTATVVLQDSTGAWNAANVSSPYYGKLLPLRKIQIFADYNGVRYFLFSGFITSFITNFSIGNEDQSTVTLQCADGFRLLYNVNVSTVTGTSSPQLSGARISSMLDYVSWPTTQRAIDTGDSTMQADPATQRSLLDALQLVADKSEFGAFFMDVHGNATFLSRTNATARSGATPTVYSDDGIQIGYQDISIAHDDVLVVNDVAVTRLGGVTQEVFDATSIATYFTHSGSRTDILVQTDAEALNQATMILAARKDATLRIDSLTLNLFDSSAPTRIVAGLSTDIFQPVNVTKTMPGASSITTQLLVQGVWHDITKKSFITKVLTSQPILLGMILDDAVHGVLDGSSSLLSY